MSTSLPARRPDAPRFHTLLRRCLATALAAALGLGSGACSQDGGPFGTSPSRSGSASPASSSQAGGRGGNAPADDQIIGRPDGGTDRRRVSGSAAAAEGGALRHSLAYPTGDRQTSVVMLEVDGPEQVRVGQPYQYTLRVSNLTDTPLHGVVVRDLGGSSPTVDTRPAARRDAAAAGARLAAAEARRDHAVEANGERLEWSVGTLAPKQTMTRQFSGTADEVGTISNCLAVTYSPTLCLTTKVVQPDVQVVKQGPSEVMICDDITYSYTVSNVGTGTAQNVTIQDPLAEGLTTEDGRDNFTANVGELGQGKQKTVNVKLRAARTGRFASRATARIAGDTAQSRQVTTLVREPVLAVTVEGPEAEYVGENVNYRVTVRNTGDAPAERTVVRFEAAGAASRADNRDVGTIPPGEARSFPVTLTAGRQPGDLTLNATAEAVCARPARAQTAVAIRTISALQLECVDANDPVKLGENTSYTITVRNEGSGPDTNVAVRATLPRELQYVGAKGATRVTASGQNLTFAPVATLESGATATWTVQVRAIRPGDVRFRVELNSDALGAPATETEPTKLYGDKPTAEEVREEPAGEPRE